MAGESEKQESWVKKNLAAAARKKQPILVICHHPFFVKQPEEADSYYNLPIAKRKELLDLCQRSGVVAILAGHTHRTITNDFGGIQMVAGETTSRNFDHRPLGFR